MTTSGKKPTNQTNKNMDRNEVFLFFTIHSWFYFLNEIYWLMTLFKWQLYNSISSVYYTVCSPGPATPVTHTSLSIRRETHCTGPGPTRREASRARLAEGDPRGELGGRVQGSHATPAHRGACA